MLKGKKRSVSTAPSSETNQSGERQIDNRVRQMREERRWTQWQLAKISRLSERTIQRVEGGSRLGSTAEMALAGAFGVEISDLYESTARASVVDFRFLKRLLSGPAVLTLFDEGEPVAFQIDRLKDSEVDPVMDFIENLHMLLGMWKDINPREHAKAHQILSSKIDGLDALGFWIFGGRSREGFPEGTENQVVRLAIVKSDNPWIIQPESLSVLGKQMCGVVVVLDQWFRVVSPLQLIAPLEGIRDVITREIRR